MSESDSTDQFQLSPESHNFSLYVFICSTTTNIGIGRSGLGGSGGDSSCSMLWLLAG